MSGAAEQHAAEELAPVAPIEDRLGVLKVIAHKFALGPRCCDWSPIVLRELVGESLESSGGELGPLCVEFVVGDVVEDDAPSDGLALGAPSKVRRTEGEDGPDVG